MKLRRTAITLALSLVLLPGADTSASAETLKLNFSGTWFFHDPQQDSPDFWNAMASVGVGPGTPVTFSMLVDTVDTNPDSQFGAYAVSGSTVDAGALHLTTLQQTLNLDASGLAGTTVGIAGSNAWLGPAVGSWLPSYMQLSTVNGMTAGSQTDDLTALVGDINRFPELLLRIGFQQPGGCGLCMGTSRLTMVSVQSVPGPAALLVMTVGALIGARTLRRRQPRRA